MKLSDRSEQDPVAMLVREFGAPRQGVLGLIEMLQGRAPSPHQRDCAELVRHSGALLLSIVSDLLGPPSAGPGAPEAAPVDFDLRDLIDGLVMIAAPALRARRLAIRADYPRSVPTLVRGDAARVRQVLLILLSNAVRSTEMGGVTLAVAGLPAAGPDRLRLRLSVADTGPGSAPVDHGQSLAHARRLVEAMGGDIGFTSTEGQGNTFWFRLDFEPGAVQLQPVAPTSWLPAPLAILVVDDEMVNRTVTAELLRRDGHRVDTAADGAGAVAAVQEGAFDLVLLDIRMDGMDGVEAARRIRVLPHPIKAQTPIIAMTADVTAEDAAACRAAGVTDLILKPLDKAALAAILKRIRGGPDDPAAVTAAAADEDGDAEALLDLVAVRERVAVLGGAMVADIVERFRSTSEQRLETLDLAWTEGQTDAARAQAHAMAGGAGSLGMIGLSRHLNAFENAVRNSRTDEAAMLRDEIATLRRRSLAALGRVLGDGSRL